MRKDDERLTSDNGEPRGPTSPTRRNRSRQDDLSVEVPFPRIGWYVAVGVAALGLLLIGNSKLIGVGDDKTRVLFGDIGKVVLMAGAVAFLYEVFVRYSFFRTMRAEMVDLLEPLRREERKLGDTIALLQNTVEMASGAVESGIAAIYAERSAALGALEALLTTAGKGTRVCLSGISLIDFLGPHGRLSTFLQEQLARRNLDCQVLILDDKCSAARDRARREEPDWFQGRDGYEKTKCHGELLTATNEAERYAQEYGPHDGEPGFAWKKYSLPPLCFVAIVGDHMFLENYNYKGRGGESPVMRISKYRPGRQSEPSRLYEVYSKHFESVWDNPLAERADEAELVAVVSKEHFSREPQRADSQGNP